MDREIAKVAVPFVDMLGRPINEGDYFAYPIGAGRSQTMAIFRFISAECVQTTTTFMFNGEERTRKYIDYKIKAKKVESVWFKNYTDRDSILRNGENALLLDEGVVLEHLNKEATK